MLHYLTGELVTELSSASAAGLLSVHRRDWDADALELGQIGADQLPPILPTTAVLKLKQDVARNMGLPEGLPVAVGAADGSAWKSRHRSQHHWCGRPFPRHWRRRTHGRPGAELRHRRAAVLLRPHRRRGGYWRRRQQRRHHPAVGGETFAPDLVAGGHADVDVLKLAAQAPVGSDGLVMLPYVLSERAPLWNADLSGAYLGIRAYHTRSHFVRAAIEGVCLQLSTIVDALDSVAPVVSIRATGGPFRSELWRQVMAATLARPMSIEAAAGGTALGAAALGW